VEYRSRSVGGLDLFRRWPARQENPEGQLVLVQRRRAWSGLTAGVWVTATMQLSVDVSGLVHVFPVIARSPASAPEMLNPVGSDCSDRYR
jgi:hypothetical protein